MDTPLVFVALPLVGALVAIAWYQVSLGRAERVFYRAAAWSLWSAAVVGGYLLIHTRQGATGVEVVSTVFYTMLASGLPVGLALVRHLHEGEVAPATMRRWYALAILVAVLPASMHLVLPPKIVVVHDALGGPIPLSTIGPLGGAVTIALALPVLWRMRRWMRDGVTHVLRRRSARVIMGLFLLVIANDVTVIAGMLPSTLLFPLFAAVQAIVLHGLLVSESVHVYQNLEVAVASRTRELEAQRAELHQAVESLRTVMAGLPDGVLVIDDDRIVFVNETTAQLVGCPASELIGSRPDAWFTSDRLRELALEAVTSAQRVGPLQLEQRGLALEADALGVELLGRRTALVILRDVSERARMRELLLRSDRLASMGTLIAGVAHEINNPLAYVLGNLEALAHPDPPSAPFTADQRASILEATDGAVRIRGIVESMRTFARPAISNIASVDLRDVARDAIKLTRNTVEHQASLVLELGDVPPILADRAQLGQVAVNLIVNAVHACRVRSTIRIVTRVGPTREARLEIHDTGIGMTEEVRARAFDPFYTTKAVGSGTGLGLSICHGIATAFGGRIELDSTAGEGTVAALVMPSIAEATAAAAEPAPAQLATASVSARVLIIDDDPGVARALRRMLRGSDVVIAHDREQVEAAIATGAFDLVLCDLMMPGLTGIELFERMERDAPEVAARMVFMTGGAFTTDAVEFVERMGDRCLLKPIRATALRDLVVRSVVRDGDVAESAAAHH